MLHTETRSTRHRLNTLLMVLVALLFILAARCQQPDGTPAPTATPAPPSAPAAQVDSHGLHALNHTRLQEIMRDLKRMDFAAISDEIAATGSLNRDICDVSRHAAALAADAHVIPVIFADYDISPESRRVLNMLAARLHLQALELQEAADRNNAGLVRERLERMIQTCNDCHHSFRAPPVADAGWSQARRVARATRR